MNSKLEQIKEIAFSDVSDTLKVLRIQDVLRTKKSRNNDIQTQQMKEFEKYGVPQICRKCMELLMPTDDVFSEPVPVCQSWRNKLNLLYQHAEETNECDAFISY